MRNLRLALRSAGLGALTCALALAWVLGVPFAAALGRFHAWRGAILQTWARGVGRILGMRIAVEGRPPRAPFLRVANHLSYVDVVLLAASLRCAFVSKAEVARWPVIGLLARMMGTVFVDRRRRRELIRVGARMRALLAAGQALVLFPEGTSSAGRDVHEFRSALLQPAAELGLPVRHAALRYQTPPGEMPATLAVSWWGEMTFVPHLSRLLRLPGFEARLVFGPEPIVDRDRKRLARRLQRAVAERFLPMGSVSDV